MKILIDRIMDFVYYFALFISICLLLGYSFASLADDMYLAEVGKYDSNGKIQLNLDRFETTFPDGGIIDLISVIDVNGFIYIVRKGFDRNGVCRSERVELVNRELMPLTAGSDPLEGTPVFIFSESNSYRRFCQDKGCNILNNLEVTDQITFDSAVCDITEASDFKCACHLQAKGTISIIQNDKLCVSAFKPTTKVEIEDWIRDECPVPNNKIDSNLIGRVMIIPC